MSLPSSFSLTDLNFSIVFKEHLPIYLIFKIPYHLFSIIALFSFFNNLPQAQFN